MIIFLDPVLSIKSKLAVLKTNNSDLNYMLKNVIHLFYNLNFTSDVCLTITNHNIVS